MKKIAILLFSLVLWTGAMTAQAFAPLQITTTQLPDATIGQPYSAKIKAKGGNGPYAWTPLSTTYPAGCCILGLNGNDGFLKSHYITFDTQSSDVIVDNFPAGTYYWDIKVEDALGNIDVQTISLTILPAVE